MAEPTLEDIRVAADRIRPYIHRTPVLTSSTFNRMCNAELFFKCENLQKVGAFKIRGATNAVFSLADEEAARGVATHSSGNHAAALALAAWHRGITAYVVMPENAPPVKRAAVEGYGGQVFTCVSTLEARETRLEEVVALTGATVVHPYNDYRVIAGQATAALELLEDVADLDVVMAPVGGGGLLSGTALAVHAITTRARVIAAEPERADDAFRSLQAGQIKPLNQTDTIADGLRTSLGSLTFPIIQKHVEQIVRVSEEAIISTTRLVWERMKIVVEPSGVLPLAALLSNAIDLRGKRVGIIFSGGNIDLNHLPWFQ